MASDPELFLTPEQYLTHERQAEFRSEYWHGQLFAMTGASRYHNRIAGNLSTTLHNGLRHTACRPYQADMRVHIPATGLCTYPDVLVTCGTEQFLDTEADTLLNPVLVIEVLSEATKNYDLGGKFENYRSIPSFREYLTVEQDRIGISHWTRQEDGLWLLREWRDPLGAIQLVSVPLMLRIADIYDNVWDTPDA